MTKHLNGIPDFVSAVCGTDQHCPGKVSLCGESFWLRDCCREGSGGGEGGNIWYGIIDNHLFFDSEHELAFGDRVSFTKTD